VNLLLLKLMGRQGSSTVEAEVVQAGNSGSGDAGGPHLSCCSYKPIYKANIKLSTAQEYEASMGYTAVHILLSTGCGSP